MRQGNKSKIRSPELHALYNTEEETALSENRSSKANMVSKDYWRVGMCFTNMVQLMA